VAVVAVGALLKITDANKKSQTLKTAINNLNFAMESMSREMRVGTNYAAGPTEGSINFNYDLNEVRKATYETGDSDWVIAFNSSRSATWSDGSVCSLVYMYRYDHSEFSLSKAQQTACGENLTSLDFHPVISSDVKITNSIINIDSNSGSTVKPRAFFWFKGYTGEATRQKTEFELQTTVSQRVTT
jgi:hypothetical protein